MHGLDQDVDSIAAATGFSGVVRVDLGGEIELAKAYGLADRGHVIPNTLDTQFAIASGSKGFTAVTVASLSTTSPIAIATTSAMKTETADDRDRILISRIREVEYRRMR